MDAPSGRIDQPRSATPAHGTPSDIDWDTGQVTLAWVVVEEGSRYRLRRLTKDGDADAAIHVDMALLRVLKVQRERQERDVARLGEAWIDQGLVFARDAFKLRRADRPGGPQDPEMVRRRWVTLRARLGLPEGFRIHDLRHSHITNALDAGENPVEVSANARHHSPAYTMARYGHSRAEGARKLAAGTADRTGLSRLI